MPSFCKPPPCVAELPLSVLLVKVKIPAARIAPPLSVAELPRKSKPVALTLPRANSPPPSEPPSIVLLMKATLTKVSFAWDSLYIPPPLPSTVLLITEPPFTVSVPKFSTPPP